MTNIVEKSSRNCSVVYSSKLPLSFGFHVSETPSCLFWILDSGATYHMTPYSKQFSTYSLYPSNKQISTAYGTLDKELGKTIGRARERNCLDIFIKKENTPEPPPTTKLEERLLDDTKIKKVDTKDNGYEEALRGNHISSNQGLDAYKFNESKNHKACLRPNKNESKDKKKVKEKLHKKPDQKYEPPHWRKGKEESCMAWMF
ncbi:hypothetical protein KIW84_015552 [Lathyrus oleraceus]|uniref:Retrovirus-related Pol polyprotein from transposon TNT 1-94-like beta-barrel domain-containing protein n=1 Tax=Pisum sativum TaxID=3888 RepID=A0A9D5H0X2_PEA|nr:hypothetical protein KIW84_015552 [Pisum sativum]